MFYLTDKIIRSFLLIILSLFFLLLIFYHLPDIKTPSHSSIFTGIISGPEWGSFAVLGSFAVQFGDHLRSPDHLRRYTEHVT